jgi:hypothetical protein
MVNILCEVPLLRAFSCMWNMRSVTRKKKISYPYGLQRKFKNGNAQGRTSDAVVKIRRGTRDSTLSFHLP